MKNAPLKVGVAGVRGVVGASFTPQLAMSFAQAFGTYSGRGLIVVGRDTRPSGLMIQLAVVAGLQSVGCPVQLAGVVPTPTIMYLTRSLGAHGGIAITASHNDVEWNALKFIGRDGMFLRAEHAAELFDIYHQQEFHLVDEASIPRVRPVENPAKEHLDRIRSYVDVDAIRAKHIKVAVDACNGVGALFSREFLEGLGCEVVTLHDLPTGVFERPPEPSPENLGKLGELVVRERCQVGFAQDPDGDRLAIVNEMGVPIGDDLTLAFAVRQVLSRHEPGLVVMNQPTSRCVEDVATALNSRVIRTRTGEIHVSAAMMEHQAVVGENSGGIIVPGIHPTRDSFVAMALVLELMAMESKTISALRAEIPTYTLIKKKIEIRPDLAPKVLRAIRHHFQGQPMSLLDGVFVEIGEKTLYVRRSNTEPVIRYFVEARNPAEAAELSSHVCALIESAIASG